MSLNDLSTVLKILPRLDVSELMEVKTKASANISMSSLVGSPSVPVLTQSYAVDYLLDGITFELRRRGLLGRNSNLSAKSIPGSFALMSSDVRKFLSEHVGELNPAEYALLGQLVIRCLAKYIEDREDRDVPISAKSLCQAIGKVPQALDKYYPGYLKAGLLPFAWRK